MNPFDDILRQADAALRARLYLPALFTTLTLPDICAAIGSDDGETSGPRYRAWVDTYLPVYESAELYRLRCRLLHQGTAILRNAKNPIRYFFVEPGHGSIHRIILVANFGTCAAALDLEIFVAEVSQAVRSWLAWGPKRADFSHRLWDVIQRRPSLPGVIAGVPVFA